PRAGGVMTAPGDAGRRYVEFAESLPIPGAVDWGDAPGVFKLYRGRPRLSLSDATDEAPVESDHGSTSWTGGLTRPQLGQLLSDAYGLTRQRWTAVNALRRVIGTRGAALTGGRADLDTSTLRPVASGGARFPAELYLVAGADTSVPAGVYHYDVAHHALVTLRDGDCTPMLAACLGAADAPRPALTILLSIFFWKNAFKYGELCYRLCSLDAGALLGQVLAAGRHAQPAVRYQFLDRPLDELLELDPAQESVYAAISI